MKRAGCSAKDEELLLTVIGQFETLEWSLEPEGEKIISLLEGQGRDPFQQETADRIAVVA